MTDELWLFIKTAIALICVVAYIKAWRKSLEI